MLNNAEGRRSTKETEPLILLHLSVVIASNCLPACVPLSNNHGVLRLSLQLTLKIKKKTLKIKIKKYMWLCVGAWVRGRVGVWSRGCLCGHVVVDMGVVRGREGARACANVGVGVCWGVGVGLFF